MKDKKIIIVGAGPAGMMASIRAASLSADVTLLEKKSYPGNKLLLSGKGRCNLTNTCDLEAFIANFSANGQFLRDAFKKFFHPDLMRFFEERGLALQVERQLRVFPQSGRSASVVEVLKKELVKQKVKLLNDTAVADITVTRNTVEGVVLSDGRHIPADRVILATGGASYSFTGSTGEGISLAAKLGHRVVSLKPGLVPLEIKGDYPRRLKGLTLKNIRLTFSEGKKKIVSEIGELLFTDSGISGPLVLSLSGRIFDWLDGHRQVFAGIDLKPALSAEQLDARLLREFKLNSKKIFKNTLKALLPLRLIDLFIEISGIAEVKQCSQVTLAERRKISALLKNFTLEITRTRPIEEAMVTRGGVSLKDIDPRTMGSRLVKGLYFAGEIMDVDADTGGFNLQAAFSTGYLAGESAALS